MSGTATALRSSEFFPVKPGDGRETTGGVETVCPSPTCPESQAAGARLAAELAARRQYAAEHGAEAIDTDRAATVFGAATGYLSVQQTVLADAENPDPSALASWRERAGEPLRRATRGWDVALPRGESVNALRDQLDDVRSDVRDRQLNAESSGQTREAVAEQASDASDGSRPPIDAPLGEACGCCGDSTEPVVGDAEAHDAYLQLDGSFDTPWAKVAPPDVARRGAEGELDPSDIEMPVTLKASVAVEDGRRAITTRHCASPTCVAGRRAVTDRVDRLESAVASDPETVETDWFDRELSTIESLVERHGVKASADGVWAGGEAPIAEPSELSSEAAESWLGGAETYRSVFDRLATLDETIDDLRASLLDVADVADRVVDVRRQAAEVNAALTDTREAVAAAHPAVAERVATDDAAVADEVAAADEDGAQTTEEAETADAQGFCDDCGTVMDRSVHPTFGSTTDAKQEKGFTLQAGEWTTFEVDSHCASATCASAHDDLESRFSKMEAALDRAESEPSLRDRVGRVVAEASEELDPASLVDDPGQLIDSSMSGGRELAVQFRGIVSRDPTVEFHRQANAARQQLDRIREDAEACRVTLDGELADAADTLDEIRTRAAETDGLRVGERGKALTDRIGEFVEEHEPADGLNAGEKLAELRSGMAGLDESVEAETREEAVEAEGEADEATVETETETVEAGETRGGRGDDPNGDGRVIENLGGDPDEPSRSGQSDERGPLADRLDDRLESDDDPGIEDDPRPDDGTGTDDRSERTEPTGSREDEQSPDAEEATDTDREPATTEQSDEADRSTTRDSADPRVGARAGELDREPAESGDAVSPEEATTGAHGDELNEDVVESADPVTLEEATGGTQGEEPEDVVVESTSGVTPDEATAGTHGGEPTEEPIESTDAVTPEEATTGTHGEEPTTETVESADPVTPEEATAGTDEADVATGDIAVTPSEVDADTDEPAEPDEETRDRVTPEGATAGTRPDDRAATPVRPAEARAGAGSIDPDDVDETDTESERTLVDEVEAELEEEEEDEEELGLGL